MPTSRHGEAHLHDVPSRLNQREMGIGTFRPRQAKFKKYVTCMEVHHETPSGSHTGAIIDPVLSAPVKRRLDKPSASNGVSHVCDHQDNAELSTKSVRKLVGDIH